MFGRKVKKVNVIFTTQVSDSHVNTDLNVLIDIIWSTPWYSREIVYVCCCLILNLNSFWNSQAINQKTTTVYYLILLVLSMILKLLLGQMFVY